MARRQTKKTNKRSKVEKVMEQVKEPFSLLETLKEEGMASATMFLTLMTGAAKNFRWESVRPQVKELIGSMGFATRSEIERLEGRLDELESRISALGAGVLDEDE